MEAAAATDARRTTIKYHVQTLTKAVRDRPALLQSVNEYYAGLRQDAAR